MDHIEFMKLNASKGGLARKSALSAEQRIAIAKKGNIARQKALKLRAREKKSKCRA